MAVEVYLDASALVALLTTDLFTEQARQSLAIGTPAVVVSNFAEAEFASVIGRRLRTRVLTKEEAETAFANLDTWVSRSADRVEIASVDVAEASGFLRRLDMTLRTPDALHIAIARRLGTRLLTFDKQMAAAARSLGLDVIRT